MLSLLLLLWTVGPLSAQDEPNGRERMDVRGLLREYCWKCHGEEETYADIDFMAVWESRGTTNQELWDRVEEAILEGAMPPEGEPAPSLGQRNHLLSWFEDHFALTTTFIQGYQLRPDGNFDGLLHVQLTSSPSLPASQVAHRPD